MDNLFDRLFNIYISENFDRNSVYYDEKANKSFNYIEVVNYLEKYFKYNTNEDKMYLYHEKRRKIDFTHVNILRYKNAFYKFVDGDVKYIKDAKEYIERYSTKEELVQYQKQLKKYYEEYYDIFQAYESNNFIENDITRQHRELSIPLLMTQYIKYVLKENYNLYKRKKSLTTSKCYIYLTKILECDNLEMFAKEIYEKNLIESVNTLRTHDFIMSHREIYSLTEEEVNKLEHKLTIKIKELRFYLRQLIEKEKEIKTKQIIEKYENEKISLCNELVEKYINSDFNSIKTFCIKNQISYENFKKYTEIVKKYNPELYKKFATIVKRQQAQRYMIITNMLNRIADSIINGVEIDSETKRPFDIIDYYLITNMNFEKLLHLAKKELKDEKLRLVKKFIRKYNHSVQITKTEILEERNIIMLNNKQYEVTQDDKTKVFEYLERNHIPLLGSTYNAALKRHLNNNLPELNVEDNSKIKVLK